MDLLPLSLLPSPFSQLSYQPTTSPLPLVCSFPLLKLRCNDALPLVRLLNIPPIHSPTSRVLTQSDLLVACFAAPRTISFAVAPSTMHLAPLLSFTSISLPTSRTFASALLFPRKCCLLPMPLLWLGLQPPSPFPVLPPFRHFQFSSRLLQLGLLLGLLLGILRCCHRTIQPRRLASSAPGSSSIMSNRSQPSPLLFAQLLRPCLSLSTTVSLMSLLISVATPL